DRGKRLTPEPERRHADQVRRIADLAGGVARQRQLRILATHPRAVVAHPDERLAAVFDRHADRARAGIERVLDQLLDDRGRPLDHLACRDLVGDLGGQDRDLGHHSGTTSAASTQPRTPSCRSTRSQAPARRSTYSAAPASSVMAALAAPYGATRTGVPGLAITATGRARCRHSRAASPPHAAVARPNTISAMPRRRAATASHSPTHPAAAPRAP